MMNTQNIEDLKDTLKYKGFGDQVNAELEKAIASKAQTFTLKAEFKFDMPMTIPGDPKTQDRMSYDLNFKQGKNELYYFNSFTARIDSPLFVAREQAFYLDKGKGFTAKEAYNLLAGRSVLKTLESKEGNRYKAFIQMDFAGERKPNGNYPVKSYHQNYGFNVSEAIRPLPIRFSSIEDRDKLVKSLEKGNLQKVQMDDGQTLYAKTSPASKSVRLYDERLQPVRIMEGKEQKAKQETPMAMAGEPAEEEKNASKKKKGVKI